MKKTDTTALPARNSVAAMLAYAPKFAYSGVKTLAWPGAWLFFRLKVSANQISGTRLFSPVVFFLLWTSKVDTFWYIFLLLLYGYSDAVDGVLSGPKFENKPPGNIGALLDSIADKLFIVSAYLFHYENFPILVLTTSIGEFVIGITYAAYMFYRVAEGTSQAGLTHLRSNYWGKYKLATELITAVTMTFYHYYPSEALERTVIAVGGVAVMFLLMSVMSKVRSIFS